MKTYLASFHVGPCDVERVAKHIGGFAGTERVYVRVMAEPGDETSVRTTVQDLCSGAGFRPRAADIRVQADNPELFRKRG